ncbi:hypothetical protein [Dyadobacter sediminis]|uniref:3-oxoacyl-ACP synthase n=1 Tax=Dyadobacter sediminis TaxID=1493691 RepID=A0A5R9KKT4_9BACT|nr:hypothetical protein [Dyadobacter sediminis]TLU96830.1 hypothetical protein FEM55_06810 [Dyadobacter sediminis]GGB85495.1 hypothetical protein GCM10011325_11370 [Dyadobacter sediminis]
MNFITAYGHLQENSCAVNGETICRRDKNSGDPWFRQIYKEQEFVYPKFHKMDVLSQAGFLTSELIKRANPQFAGKYKDDEIAMLFANRSGSAETDQKFVHAYQNGTPSPSLFVYTLPNIVMGEIAILNKWYGESLFAVLPAFDAEFYINHCNLLLSAGSEAVLCSWHEIAGNQIDVFTFLIEKEGESRFELTTNTLSKIAFEGNFHKTEINANYYY